MSFLNNLYDLRDDKNRMKILDTRFGYPFLLWHKHWETWTVALAVESIKNHDTYVIENGKTIRWMKQKGRVNYGSI